MKQTSATVKSTELTDSEREQKRLARREAQYQKLCTTIERTQRKLEKADKVVNRSVRLLTKLERQRAKMGFAIETFKRMAADALVKEQAEKAESPKPKRERKKAAKPETNADGDKVFSVAGVKVAVRGGPLSA